PARRRTAAATRGGCRRPKSGPTTPGRQTASPSWRPPAACSPISRVGNGLPHGGLISQPPVPVASPDPSVGHAAGGVAPPGGTCASQHGQFEATLPLGRRCPYPTSCRPPAWVG